MLTTPDLSVVNESVCGGIRYYANHFWCNKYLNRLVDLREEAQAGLLGYSYGVFAFDPWSKEMSNRYRVQTELYDCYAVYTQVPKALDPSSYKVPYRRFNTCVAGRSHTDNSNRTFDAWSDHLATRGPWGTIVKMDVEGSEWESLDSVTDEELDKIDMLDMEVHFCKATRKDYNLTKIVRLLEKLGRVFTVVGRDPGIYSHSKFSWHWKENMSRPVCNPARFGGTDFPTMACISYVNTRRWAAVQAAVPFAAVPFAAAVPVAESPLVAVAESPPVAPARAEPEEVSSPQGAAGAAGLPQGDSRPSAQSSSVPGSPGPGDPGAQLASLRGELGWLWALVAILGASLVVAIAAAAFYRRASGAGRRPAPAAAEGDSEEEERLVEPSTIGLGSGGA